MNSFNRYRKCLVNFLIINGVPAEQLKHKRLKAVMEIQKESGIKSNGSNLEFYFNLESAKRSLQKEKEYENKISNMRINVAEQGLPEKLAQSLRNSELESVAKKLNGRQLMSNEVIAELLLSVIKLESSVYRPSVESHVFNGRGVCPSRQQY